MALDSYPTPAAEASDDGVVYPVSDNMGETVFHSLAIQVLLELLTDYFAARQRPIFVRGDQFFYYRRGDPKAVVAPDVYTLAGPLPGDPLKVKSWKTWEPGVPRPTFALEIVSAEFAKDYADTFLERYQELGVQELVRYDPAVVNSRRRELFAHFVRDASGELVRRPVFGERVYLECHDLWLVRQANDLLRIAHGPDGTPLWPTRSEQLSAEASARAAAEASARAAAEASAHAAAEARKEADERVAAAEAARAAAEAELAELRAKLAARGL